MFYEFLSFVPNIVKISKATAVRDIQELVSTDLGSGALAPQKG